MPMTTNTKLGIAQLGLQGLTGLLGGMDNSAEKNQQQTWDRADAQRAQERDDEYFQALLNAILNDSNLESDINNENFTRAQSFSNANPLGAEYNLRKGNNLFRAGLGALSDRTLAHGTPNIASGFLNRPGVSEALSDSAVNDAITQRRIATAGLDPRASAQIGGTNGYADQLLGELVQGRNVRRDNSQRMFDMVNTRKNDAAQQLLNAQQKLNSTQGNSTGNSKKRSILGTLLGIGGLAANFIPGVGPVAGTLIGAATGAAGGAIANGKKGALVGGATGAAASGALNAAGIGNPRNPRTFNNSMSPQSLPVGNFASPQSLPLIPSNPLVGGSMQVPTQNRPQYLPLPQQGQNPPQSTGFQLPSGPRFGFGNGLNTRAPQIYPAFGGSREKPQSPMGDRGRFSDAKLGGYGAPMNLDASRNFGDTAGPGMNTSAIGALLAGLYGVGATGYGGVAAGLGATPQLQQLGGRAQQLLNAGGPRALLPQLTPETQAIVQKLMNATRAYNSGSPQDVRAAQDLVRFMQPYLGNFGGKGF